MKNQLDTLLRAILYAAGGARCRRLKVPPLYRSSHQFALPWIMGRSAVGPQQRNEIRSLTRIIDQHPGPAGEASLSAGKTDFVVAKVAQNPEYRRVF